MSSIDTFEARVAERCNKLGPFRAEPHYSTLGDFITMFFVNETYYGERIDEWLTVYRSMDTDELVGFKIKGARVLVRNVTAEFTIHDDEVKIRVLLSNAMGPQAAAETKQYYYALIRRTDDVSVAVEPIRAAA